MNFLSLLGGIIGPITKLVDDVHTSDEERAALHNALAKMHIEFGSHVLDYESKLNEQRTSIVVAEARGGSWLQRSWRPITMLTFLVLVVGDALGLLANPLAPEAWTLLQIGLGGYVAGRSAEKVAPMVIRAMQEKR